MHLYNYVVRNQGDAVNQYGSDCIIELRAVCDTRILITVKWAKMAPRHLRRQSEITELRMSNGMMPRW